MADKLSEIVGILYGVQSISLMLVKKTSTLSNPYEIKNVILADEVRKIYIDKMCSTFIEATQNVTLSKYTIDKYDKNNEILWIDADKVHNLSSIIYCLNQNNIESFKLKELGNDFIPKFFVVKITSYLDGEKKELYVFNRENPSTDLKKKVIMYWEDDKFQISKESFSLRHNIDCIYDVNDQKVYILNRKFFEDIFNYNDYYKQKAKECLENIATQNIFNNIDLFNKKCIENSRIVNKLAKMQLSDELINFAENFSQISHLIEEDHKHIVFDGNNKIVVDKNTSSEQIQEILSILNDEYLKSRITDRKYVSSVKYVQQLPFAFPVS